MKSLDGFIGKYQDQEELKLDKEPGQKEQKDIGLLRLMEYRFLNIV